MLLGLKVQGGSRYMHHKIKEGDTLEAKWPANESPMANKADYNVLIVGGIRITPILSSLRKVAAEGNS